jgi:hypothetical protein
MKEKIDTQINLFEFYAEHEMGQQLKSISKFLDDHCAIVDLAAQAGTGYKKVLIPSKRKSSPGFTRSF